MRWFVLVICLLPGCTDTLPQSYIEAAQKRCEKNGGARLYEAYNITKPGVADKDWTSGWVTCNDGAIFNDVTTKPRN